MNEKNSIKCHGYQVFPVSNGRWGISNGAVRPNLDSALSFCRELYVDLRTARLMAARKAVPSPTEIATLKAARRFRRLELRLAGPVTVSAPSSGRLLS